MPRRSAPARDNYRKKQRVAPIAEPSPPNPGGSESMSNPSPSSHSYSQGFESQHSSPPSNWASPESVGAGSTPQSSYSYYDHSDQPGLVQTAGPPPTEGYMRPPLVYDASVMPNQIPSPSAGIDAVIEGGGMHAMPQSDPNMGMMPPTSGGMVPQAAFADFHPPMLEMNYGLENITDAELGDFSQLWDWRSLNLDFIHSTQ